MSVVSPISNYQKDEICSVCLSNLQKENLENGHIFSNLPGGPVAMSSGHYRNRVITAHEHQGMRYLKKDVFHHDCLLKYIAYRLMIGQPIFCPSCEEPLISFQGIPIPQPSPDRLFPTSVEDVLEQRLFRQSQAVCDAAKSHFKELEYLLLRCRFLNTMTHYAILSEVPPISEPENVQIDVCNYAIVLAAAQGNRELVQELVDQPLFQSAWEDANIAALRQGHLEIVHDLLLNKAIHQMKAIICANYPVPHRHERDLPNLTQDEDVEHSSIYRHLFESLKTDSMATLIGFLRNQSNQISSNFMDRMIIEAWIHGHMDVVRHLRLIEPRMSDDTFEYAARNAPGRVIVEMFKCMNEENGMSSRLTLGRSLRIILQRDNLNREETLQIAHMILEKKSQMTESSRVLALEVAVRKNYAELIPALLPPEDLERNATIQFAIQQGYLASLHELLKGLHSGQIGEWICQAIASNTDDELTQKIVTELLLVQKPSEDEGKRAFFMCLQKRYLETARLFIENLDLPDRKKARAMLDEMIAQPELPYAEEEALALFKLEL